MVRLAFPWCWCHRTDIGERNIIKYAHASPTTRPAHQLRDKKDGESPFVHDWRWQENLKPWRALGGFFLECHFGGLFSRCCLFMDQSVGYSRLSWVWPRGYNHGVRQARYYTQSLCNNHTFAFNAGFPCVCKLGQGGRSWQPFSEGKNGHKSFCQASINYFCDC